MAAARLAQAPATLTARESQVAYLGSLGYSARYIADLLHLSTRTVETHLARIYGKLNLSSRDELIDRMRGAI